MLQARLYYRGFKEAPRANAKGHKMATSAEVIENEITHPPSTKPIDLVHLTKQTFGSKDLEAEVLGLFLTHSTQCLTRLKSAETDKDWAEAAHAIKGSARAIGAWSLGDLIETHELAAANNCLADKDAATNAITAALDVARNYILELRGNS